MRTDAAARRAGAAQRPGIGASHRAIMLIGRWPVGRTPRELRDTGGAHDTLFGTHSPQAWQCLCRNEKKSDSAAWRHVTARGLIARSSPRSQESINAAKLDRRGKLAPFMVEGAASSDRQFEAPRRVRRLIYPGLPGVEWAGGAPERTGASRCWCGANRRDDIGVSVFAVERDLGGLRAVSARWPATKTLIRGGDTVLGTHRPARCDSELGWQQRRVDQRL